jgi:hypothetical protein
MEQRTQAENIARLKALGVSDAEIMDLLRQEAAAHPERHQMPSPKQQVR